MNVTHKITMDLTKPTNGNRINVVEGDKNSRIVNVHLYENFVSWRVPTNASVLIKWERESGVGGEYSKLADGSSAWSAVGNVLTITLSEESTEYSGNVKFSIVLTTGDSQISTFVIVANVHSVANGREGANSGASSTDIAGLQKQIGNLSDLETKNKSNLVAAINEAAKSGSGTGTDGEDGGYYTPKVSQPTTNTMLVEHTPSKAGMPAVDPVTINLPVGSDSSQNVNPVPKTDDMTQPVGMDEDGRLWTAPTKGATSEEPTYEQVGVAPYDVNEAGLFVLPDAETRIYTEGGGENLLSNIQNVVDGPWGITTVDYTVSGNTVTVNSAEISNTLWAMFTIYGIYLEPGDYTFQMQGCESMAVDLHSGTSADDSAWSNSADIAGNIKKEAVYNFTVTEGKYLKISPKKFNNSTWPVTLKFFLVAGTYDSIPDETTSLSFTVAAGEKFSLNAFNGTTMYSDPEGVAVYRPVENVITDEECVICFGDSIMTYCKVPAALNELGINAVDMAVSSACLSGGRDVNTRPYDMCHIVDALESGDLTAQINGGSQPNFGSLLSLMPSATTLLIEFGTNDFQGLVALEGEDKTSITGGLRYVLSKLCTMYPAKRIVVLSTLGWTLAGNTNDISLTLEQLNDALHNVANEYNVPFIDALHGVGLNTYTRNALTTDGCHLNTVGVQRYAKFLSGQLSALGM